MLSCPMRCMFLTGIWSQRCLTHGTWQRNDKFTFPKILKVQNFIHIVVRMYMSRVWVELRQSMFQDGVSSNYYPGFCLHAMSNCGSIACIITEASDTAPWELQFFVTLTRHLDTYMSKYGDHIVTESTSCSRYLWNIRIGHWIYVITALLVARFKTHFLSCVTHMYWPQ